MTFSVFYLIEILIRRGTFCWKPHLNRTSGSKVIAIERFSKQWKTKEMHSFFWLYLKFKAPDFQLIPLDRNTNVDYGWLSIVIKFFFFIYNTFKWSGTEIDKMYEKRVNYINKILIKHYIRMKILVLLFSLWWMQSLGIDTSEKWRYYLKS